jgi:hypothetical protein
LVRLAVAEFLAKSLPANLAVLLCLPLVVFVTARRVRQRLLQLSDTIAALDLRVAIR